jgi:ADP-sugar diphosphatase
MFQTISITIATIVTILYACINLLKKINYITPSNKWFIYCIEIIPKYEHLEDKMETLIASPKFINWLLNFRDIEIRSVTITDIDYKASNNEILFVKCYSEGYDYKTGKKIMSNISFIRGNSIAILIIVNVSNKKYVLLCEQHRLPVGKKMKEICTGIVDSEGNIKSVVLQKVKEETGFNIKNIRELISLEKIYPSPGVCDEEISLYSWTTTINSAEFKAKQKQMYECALENEDIKLSFVELEEFRTKTLFEIGDVKSECALLRYLINKY